MPNGELLLSHRLAPQSRPGPTISRSRRLRKGIDSIQTRLVDMPLDETQEVPVQVSRAGNQVAAAKERVSPVEIGDPATGLPDQEHTGREIPGRKPELEKTVVDTGRSVGQIECRGSATPNRADTQKDITKNIQVKIEGLASAKGVASGEESAVETRSIRDSHRSIVPKGATAKRCGEQIVAHRVEHRAGNHLAAVSASDGDAENR